MALFIAVALMAAGALMAWSLGGAFWVVWRGVTALSLVFVGLIALIIAISERRAKKLYRQATQNKTQNLDVPPIVTDADEEI